MMPNKERSEEDLQRQVAMLQRQVAELTQMMGGPGVAAPRVPVWVLIREYLRGVGGTASPSEITNGLLKAGHKLGKYPLRNVAITVKSPPMRSVFRITRDATDQETVHLLDRPISYKPKFWEAKKQPRSKKG